MKSEDIDRILASETTITPSPEFLRSVMCAVEREAASLPPLEFPWLRALPGLLATVVAVVAAIAYGIGVLSDPAAFTVAREQLAQAAIASSGLGLQWLVLTVAITTVAMALSWSLARGGSYA